MPPASELPSGTVTFLFTDMEGSTRLLKRLGRQRYGELLVRHNELLRSVFEEHAGIEVDRQGDAFCAVFRSAGSAVAAAAEAQRVLAGEQWPESVVVRVRIGLHTGEATLGDGGYVGLAIHLAAHVGAAARGGQSLLTGTTAKIVEHELPAGGRLRDLGERPLKGLERPERLYALELDDLPVVASTEPPARADGRRPAPLLERDADLAALRALIDSARDGSGRFAAIEGSAGIGKTRLLAEVRAMAAEMGLRVLSARGGELEQEFAFGIVRQLFEPLLATAPAEERAELMAGAAGLAAPLFGESGIAGAPTSGDVAFAVLHGLYWLAANAALGQPTLLLVDDLHWGDAPSLRWFAYIAHRLEGLPLMLAGGTRSPRQAEQVELLTELLSDPAAVVLRPGALGTDSIAILARDVFAVEPDAGFCAACRDVTGGNPLYLRALLTTLAADGLEPTAASSARVHEVGPEPVARAVSLRLSRLPPEAGALAQAIAVLGQGAELGLAAELARLEHSLALAAATALARAELLRPDPALEFTHPVVGAAIYETIGAVERADAHRRAAGLLAEAGAEPEQAASHLLALAPAGDPFVGPVLRQSAQRALARGAADAAVSYLRRALAEPPPAAERAETLRELGVVERGLDLSASVEHLRESVSLSEDANAQAEAALEYLRTEMYAHDDIGGATRLARAAAERLGQARSELRELLEAEVLSATLGADDELYATAKELLSGIDDATLPEGLGADLVLAALAHYEVRLGADRAKTIALAERSLASGRLERVRGFSLFYPAHALGAAGELDAAMAFYACTIEQARRGGELLTLSGLLGFRGSLSTEQGDLLSAEQDLREGLELAKQSGVAGNVMYLAAWLAEFLVERGALDEAASLLGGLGLPEELPVSIHSIFFLTARGRLRLEQRQAERALGDFLAIGRIDEAFEIHNPAFRPWRSHAAAALHALGREDEARELASEELELSRRWGSPRTVGVSLRMLGLVDRLAEREHWLREAVDMLADSPSRLEHARALVDLGAALRRRNARAEARELLRQGAELAHGCGAMPLLERANEELAATGARPRKLLLTGLESLTASERRVAQLAAEEMSNKEIAQTLFVTVKTVEVHLSNVYRKLEIGSRRQLPAALVGPRPAEPVPAGG